MILIIDNYDSFTYNLVDYFLQLGLHIHIEKNDVHLEKLKSLPISAVVISPGPETPQKAGVTIAAIDYFHTRVPILGICLGHQAIGEYFGCKLQKASKPMHGKTSTIQTKSDILYDNLPDEFTVTRYHSLVLKQVSKQLKVTSTSKDDTEIMSIKHKTLPIWGVQYHPEAYLTANGLKILENWTRFNHLMPFN